MSKSPLDTEIIKDLNKQSHIIRTPCKSSIVSTFIWKGQLIVTTQRCVYNCIDNKLVPIEFKVIDNE